jgi:hypothetical protein
MPSTTHAVPLRDPRAFQRHLALAQHQARRPATQVRVLKLDHLDPADPEAIIAALKSNQIDLTGDAH